MNRNTDIPPAQPGEKLTRSFADQLIRGANTARFVSGSDGIQAQSIGGAVALSPSGPPINSDQDVLVVVNPSPSVTIGSSTALGYTFGSAIYTGTIYEQDFTTIKQDEGPLSPFGINRPLTPSCQPESSTYDCFVVNLCELDSLDPNNTAMPFGEANNGYTTTGTNLLPYRMTVVGRIIGSYTAQPKANKVTTQFAAVTLPLVAIQVPVMWQPVYVKITATAGTGNQYTGQVAKEGFRTGSSGSLLEPAYFTTGAYANARVLSLTPLALGISYPGLIVGQQSNTSNISTSVPIVSIASSGGTNKFRITSVSGTFPTWTYTGNMVTAYASSSSSYTVWVVGTGSSLTAVNRMEFGSTASTYTYGNGVTITSSSGQVNSTSCLIVSIGVGAVVDLSVDANGTSSIYSFAQANSAQ